jgi:hypothetical protein
MNSLYDNKKSLRIVAPEGPPSRQGGIHMRKIVILAALVACVSVSASAMTLYTSPDDATKHCRSTVVWLNTKTNIYHMPGSHDYGNTKDGAFVCQKAADKAGARPAANGQ